MSTATNSYTLRDALKTYFNKRELKPSSVDTMRFTINSFLRHVNGTDIALDAVTQDRVNEWLGAMSCSDRTKIKHRGNMLSILRDAADDGHCSEPVARRIRKPRKPRPQPKAWSIDELQRVVRVCDDLIGNLRRHGGVCPACVYFGCLVRIAFETGLRRGNIIALTQADVHDDGTVYVKHEKTGQPHVCTISQDTVKLFRQLPGEKPFHWKDNKSFYERWRKICKAANVPRGALQRIRKTASTSLWTEAPDNPTRVQMFLGHLTHDMWKHYVDQSKGTERPPAPKRPEFF